MPDGDLRFSDDYAGVHRFSDGTKARLRLLRHDDREPLLAGFDRLSPESRSR